MKELLISLIAAFHLMVVKCQQGPPPNFFEGRPPPPEMVEQIIRSQQQAAMSQFPPNILQAAFMAENGIGPFDFNRPGSDFPPGFQPGPPRPDNGQGFQHHGPPRPDDTLAFQPGPPRPENFGGPIPPPPITQSTPVRNQVPPPRSDRAPTTDRKVIPIHFDPNPIRPEPSEGPRVSVLPAPPHLKPHKHDYLKKEEEKRKDAQRIIFPTGSISPVDTLKSGQFRDKLIKASDNKPKPSVLVIPLPRPKTKKDDVRPEKRFTPSPGPIYTAASRKIEELDRLRGSHSYRKEYFSERPKYTSKQTEFRPTPPSSFEERNYLTKPDSTHSFYKPKVEYGFKPIGSEQEEEEARNHKIHSDGSVTRNRFSSSSTRQENSRQYSSFLGKRPVPSKPITRPNSESNRYRDDKEHDPYTADESVETGTSHLNVRESPASKKAVTLTFDCKGGKDLGWCVLGDRYPRSEVDHIVDECEEVIQAMYVDSADEWGNQTLASGKQRGGTWSWSDYVDEPMCSSDRKLIRPAFAKDVKGNWHVVIQTEKYMQKVPTVICRNADAPCNHLSNCGIRSKCIQKYAHRLLVSIDPSKPQECPGMRLYKFPSDCVCYTISSASGSYN